MFSFAVASFATFSADMASLFNFIALCYSSITVLRLSSLRSNSLRRSYKRVYCYSIIAAVLAYNSSYFSYASIAFWAASFSFCALFFSSSFESLICFSYSRLALAAASASSSCCFLSLRASSLSRFCSALRFCSASSFCRRSSFSFYFLAFYSALSRVAYCFSS